MTLIEIVSRFFSLIIAIIVTVLVSKLKYFKNAEKASGKKMMLLGSWIYAIFSIVSLLSVKLFGFIIWSHISYIGLILAIIGFVVCIINNHKKAIDVKNKKTLSDNDIKNVLD